MLFRSKIFPIMPFPDTVVVEDGQNILIVDEVGYEVVEIQSEHDKLFPCLTAEQRGVYNTIMEAVDSGNGGVFFLYGYGGTGKTFLWKTLCSALRARCDIVVHVALSGIASLLLPK